MSVLGGYEMISREAFEFNAHKAYGNRDELDLPGRQNKLVGEAMKLGKPTAASNPASAGQRRSIA